MSVILGIGAPCGHDPAAALLVNGKLIACVEEERFNRIKHSDGKLPLEAIKYCLAAASLTAADIEHVCFAWSPSAYNRAKWHHALGMLLTSPKASRKAVTKASKINKIKQQIVLDTLKGAGIDRRRVRIHYVEHHLAHAASTYLLSGFKESAIMSIDGSGEFISILIAEGKNNRIRKIKEFYTPHSLGLFYSTVTEFLGFRSDDGEYKVMGMAAYGDPSKADLSFMIRPTRSGFRVNNDYVWVVESKRHMPDKMYSKKMVQKLGPPRTGDGLTEPYIHIAARTQKILEEITIKLMTQHLGGILNKHQTLCLAGGCALNVKMNQKILQTPLVKNLYIQPGSNDAGTPLGAAVHVANKLGETLQPMQSALYGPEFSMDEIEKVLKNEKLSYVRHEDAPGKAAQMLADGEVVGWFQGRMEFGPRGLGNRSILGNPSIKGTSDRINNEVKFREPWRPFCPSILEEYAPDILNSTQPSPFMTVSFLVNEKWRSKVREIVHIDGSARPQLVSKLSNPKFYALIKSFHQRTGIPLVINTSLNRKGEPIVCTPKDALVMFFGCGLKHIFIGDFLISKIGV